MNRPTDSHSPSFLMIFPGQHWLRERVSVLPSVYIVRFVTFGPMTVFSFIVTLMRRQGARSTRAERDATFGTFIVGCYTLSADDAVTTRRRLCQWPYGLLKRILSLAAVEVCPLERRCVNDRPRLVSHLWNSGSKRSWFRSQICEKCMKNEARYDSICIWVSMQSAGYSCPILERLQISIQIYKKY
jgi:hypothetical protein